MKICDKKEKNPFDEVKGGDVFRRLPGGDLYIACTQGADKVIHLYFLGNGNLWSSSPISTEDPEYWEKVNGCFMVED